MTWQHTHTSNLLGRERPRATVVLATRREADWRRRNAQGYLLALRSHPERASLIDAEYERTEIEGPGFRRMHSGSVNEPDLRGRLTTDEGQRVDRAAERLRRRATLKRTRRRRYPEMTAVEEKVLRLLTALAQTYDHVHPSYEAIARATGSSRRAVAYAIASMKRQGWIQVKRHWITVPGPFQANPRQHANSYCILVDKIEQQTRMKRAPAHECKSCTPKNP